jgi:hypothetical protein
MIQDLDQLIASRGSASLLELGIETEAALALVKKRPDLEPVFLVRFKSRQGKTRVEEVRAYAWPSQQIALGHLGYRAEDTRLLRLEPRQPVPFPARLYARFESTPKDLEELRKTEKAYDKAMKQAASKPGRAEMELVPLIAAFKKLGDDVALEMLIETAGAYQRLDNPTYASKMLGNLLKLVEKNKKSADDSLLARTVLAAADDGVFNAKLYDFTWETLGKKQGVATALAFGVRVFRRLVQSGRALPTDFVKDMRKAAIKGRVEAEFARLFDETIVWAVGEASFWNTARRTSSWRDEETKDHAETQLLRGRFAELWKKAGTPEAKDEGTAWKAEVWGRLQNVMSELTSYGRTVLVETLLATEGALDKEEAERLLEATLATLSKAPRSSDRARVENVASKALARIADFSHDLLWEKSALFEEALRAATGDLTSFVALADLLSDLSESIPSRGTNGRSTSLLRSLPGLEAAWTGALVSALAKTEKPRNDDDDDDDDSDSSNLPPIVSVLGESLALLTPATASTHLAELGPLLASRLSKDLHHGGGLAAWGRVLGTLRALGPIGVGITSEATARFVKSSGDRVAFRNASEIAHLLDADALRAAAESRRIVDEALEAAAKSAHVPGRTEKVMKPEKELGGDGVNLLEVVKVPGGPYHLLWSKGDDSEIKAFAVTAISADLEEQTVVMKSDAKGAANVKLWATPEGTRVLVVKERLAQLYDLDGKVLHKLTLPEEFKGSWGCTVYVDAERFGIAERSEHVIVFDHKLSVVAEIEGKGYGSWSFLDTRVPGATPVVIHQSYSDLRAVYVDGGRKLPDPKLPGFEALTYGLRFEDGAYHIDYKSKKAGVRRARFVEGAWKIEPPTPVTMPVVDACVWGRSAMRTWNQPRLAYACADDDENYEVYDFNDQLLCGVENREDAKLIDLDAGVGIYPEVILVDASVPVRMAASLDLRTAAKEAPAETVALARALYADRARLAEHLKALISERPSGRSAIVTLGPYADPLIDSAAGIVLPLLAARASVLESLERPAPALSSVPPRVPGVRRTEIRRVVRELVDSPLDGLVFWAIDGADPGPVVEYLFPKDAPVSSDAWATALSLLGLAQRASTSEDLATRALDIAAAIADALANTATSKFKLDPEDYSYVEDDDDAAEGQRLPKLLEVERGSSEGIVNKPAGKYGKAAFPIAWVDESEARQRAVHAWIQKEIVGASADPSEAAREPKIVGKNEENTRIYRVLARSELSVDVTVVFKKDTFKWELTSVAGTASSTAWGELLAELGARTCALPGAVHDGIVWPARAVVLPAAVESLRRGIELTRANISRRETLRPLTWDAPELKGVIDPKGARFVMLAWLHGTLGYEAAKTTRQAFEKIAKTCKIVTASYYGLQPQQGKESDDVGSAEFKLLRFTSLVAGGTDRDKAMDTVIVLRDPAELVAAYTKEIGPAALTPKKSEKK